MLTTLYTALPYLYNLSLYSILLFSWYLLSLNDRVHLRVRANIYGKNYQNI